MNLARVAWCISEAFEALGDWFEDLATAADPAPLRDQWKRVRSGNTRA